jgi:alcohol dehydrogenase class IV
MINIGGINATSNERWHPDARDTFLTAFSGLDALTHTIEAYVSLGASPLTDLHALRGMRLVSAGLEKSLAEALSRTGPT